MIAETSEELWAKHGLTGLVIGALIFLIVLFIRALAKKDADHQEFLAGVLSGERADREAARRSNAENSRRLSSAIQQLADQIRKKDE